MFGTEVVHEMYRSWWSRKRHRDLSGTEMDLYRNGLSVVPNVAGTERALPCYDTT